MQEKRRPLQWIKNALSALNKGIIYNLQFTEKKLTKSWKEDSDNKKYEIIEMGKKWIKSTYIINALACIYKQATQAPDIIKDYVDKEDWRISKAVEKLIYKGDK